jgi:hypothetical protein
VLFLCQIASLQRIDVYRTLKPTDMRNKSFCQFLFALLTLFSFSMNSYSFTFDATLDGNVSPPPSNTVSVYAHVWGAPAGSVYTFIFNWEDGTVSSATSAPGTGIYGPEFFATATHTYPMPHPTKTYNIHVTCTKFGFPMASDDVAVTVTQPYHNPANPNDVNYDGVFDVNDVQAVRNACVSIPLPLPLPHIFGWNPFRGVDINGNGNLDIGDLTAIVQAYYNAQSPKGIIYSYNSTPRTCPGRAVSTTITCQGVNGLLPFTRLEVFGGLYDGTNSTTTNLPPGNWPVKISYILPGSNGLMELASGSIPVSDLSFGGYCYVWYTTNSGSMSCTFNSNVYPWVWDPITRLSVDFGAHGTITRNWFVNDIAAGTGNGFAYTFPAYGTYNITCQATLDYCGLSYTTNCGTSVSIYSMPGPPGPHKPIHDGESQEITVQSLSGEILKVLFPTDAEGPGSISIYDMMGHTVMTRQVTLPEEQDFRVNMRSLNIPSGIYIVKVQTAGIAKTEKIWKK